MTELPLPPDPSPDEIGQNLRLASSLGALIDLAAALDLRPEQRRSLNQASQHLQRATDRWAEIDNQLAGRPARKPRHRGQIPKRAARTRREGPPATTGDVSDLFERLGLAPPSDRPG